MLTCSGRIPRAGARARHDERCARGRAPSGRARPGLQRPRQHHVFGRGDIGQIATDQPADIARLESQLVRAKRHTALGDGCEHDDVRYDLDADGT
jgi:hypothetical protein